MGIIMRKTRWVHRCIVWSLRPARRAVEVSGKGAGTSIHANEVRAVETLRNRAMERVTETMVYVLIGHKYSTRRKCCTFQHLALAGPAIPPQRLLRCEDTLPLTKGPRTGNLQDTGREKSDREILAGTVSRPLAARSWLWRLGQK